MQNIVKFMIGFMTLLLLAACTVQDKGNQKSTPDSEKKPIQILVIGIDTRGEEKSRSDAILVCQYDPKKRSIKIASLMRDTFVKIPTYNKGYNKLNTAYFLGGKELLVKTIKENFGITIDHVVTIDFKGFTHVIDTLVPEGIEVIVTKEMIADMNLPYDEGKHRLHGDELLNYVRFRHDQESDFGRVKRQQEVMVKIKEQLTEEMTSVENFATLPKLVEGSLKYVDSDLSMTETLSLVSTVLLHQIDSIETMTIPIENSFENKTYEHAGAVLQMDSQKNIEALSNFFTLPKPVSK
ncbi:MULTISPECIES: LCP family protein [Bacillus]|uniref:LCP family protein n=1 Tax=Bacillus TaxID=1386 RepID=UPI0003035EDF|nr:MULTISPECIES: LCP family protein [Bacillus]